MTNREIISELFRVTRENANEHFPHSHYNVNKKTIWEIFCYQNNIDEDSNGHEAEIFDTWCELWEVK